MHKKRLVMEKAVQQAKDEATIQVSSDSLNFSVKSFKFWFHNEL